LLTDKTLGREGLQKTLDPSQLGARSAGERGLHVASPAEELGREEIAGLGEEELRALEIVEEEPELLLTYPAVRVEDVTLHQ
jgi:hypothetical protein